MEALSGTQICLRMEENFPEGGTTEEKLKFLVKYAILAPSVRNSQPWNFKIEKGSIQLSLDRSRARRTSDPELRELIISCGAALEHLRVAARRFGLDLIIDSFPKDAPELLAVVRLDGKKPPDEMDTIMFYAIHKWLNVPQPFRQKRVPNALLDEMHEMAKSDQTWLHLARQKSSRDTLAGLVAEGDMALKKVDENRKKLAASAAHSKRRRLDKGAGLKMDVAQGAGHIASYIQSFLSRPPSESKVIAKTKQALAESEPVLAILGTRDNTPAAWLAAGQALAAVLLRGLAVGVRASFLNQAVTMPELRSRLVSDLGLSGHPQVLFRIGFPDSAVSSRPLAPEAVTEEFI